MQVLAQPLEQKLIRPDPIFDGDVVLDALAEDLSFDKQEAIAPEGKNLGQSFAFFANEGYIKAQGWVELDVDPKAAPADWWPEAMKKLSEKDLYFANR